MHAAQRQLHNFRDNDLTLKQRIISTPILGTFVRTCNALVHLAPRLDEVHREIIKTKDSGLQNTQDVARALEGTLAELAISQQAANEKITMLGYRVSEMLSQVRSRDSQNLDDDKTGAPKSTAKPLLAQNHAIDEFYIAFENTYRGPEEVILERLKVYLPYFAKTNDKAKKLPLLDIGCGRGEMLDLAGQNKIKAVGLDINEAMVKRCLEKGYEAHQGDALSYLRKQATNSFRAITGFHIVEHIPFDELLEIFTEAYRVLAPSGVLIMETPNPENIIVSTHNFYMDPSHLHPLPPELLNFTLQTRGFDKVESLRLHPAKEGVASEDKLVDEMAKRFFGPQDQAVIAYK